MPTIKYLGGKAELAFGENVIEPQFLGDITVNLVEGTRTTSSLGGNITTPSGAYETAEITGSFLLPSISRLWNWICRSSMHISTRVELAPMLVVLSLEAIAV